MTNRETAARLTGAIFIPGVAANWFQQEAMVRHGQSDVRNKTRKWCEEPEAGGLTVDSRSGKKKQKNRSYKICVTKKKKKGGKKRQITTQTIIQLTEVSYQSRSRLSEVL